MKKYILALVLALSLISLPAQPAGAVVYQENPDAAKQIFSGLALLWYYSSSLDPVLQKDPVATKAGLDKMPFVNIPAALGQPTTDFAGSSVDLAASISNIYVVWQKENTLVKQYRLKEAGDLANQVADRIVQARNQIAQLRSSVESTGVYLKIDNLKPGNATLATYQEVLAKIQRLEDMLNLYGRSLLDTDKLKELLGNGDLSSLASDNPDFWKTLLAPTELTLNLDPQTAFVGDNVNFAGTLTSQGDALGQRRIQVLLNSTAIATVETDAAGRFQGTFPVPYQYIPQMEVQAIYYPEDEDIGVYLGSSSPIVILPVRFYQVKITLQADNPAYPGRQAVISGKLDYGAAPPLVRPIELYFDDSPIAHFSAGTSFSQKISLPPDTELGGHPVALVVPAQGRYAPANAAYSLEVALALVNLDLKTPYIGLIPGSLGIQGKVTSVHGPLQNADITLQMGGTTVRAVSDNDGTFTARINRGPELSLIGSQSITVQVQPQEPWNAPVTATRNLFMINILSCGVILLVLLLLAFYLPRRFKKWFRSYGEKAPRPKKTVFRPPSPAPVPITRPVAGIAVENRTEEEPSPAAADEPPETVFNLYRLILKLVEKMTRAILKPQQTLREYARENSQALGPLAKYFIEFTLLIERAIYSSHKVTGAEISRSQQLSRTINGEAKGENF